MSFLAELKRRNVIRVAVAYVIVSWLLLQVSDTLVPALRLPEWFHSGVAFLLIIGFPIALILAWAFELTPEGLRKDKDVDRLKSAASVSGRKLDITIITALALALAYFAYDEFVIEPTQESEAAPEIIATEVGQSIAVLPFINMSPDPDQEYFADGLSEEILNLLAKLPELKVVARTSSFAYKGKNEDIRLIGEALDVKTILEGSVRKSGDRIRVTAQLIDAADGSHIWSETYDRTMTDVFEVQDDVAAAIIDALEIHVDTIPTRGRPTEVADAYALYLNARASLNTQDHQAAETALLQATALDPEFAEAYELLAHVYSLGFIPGYQDGTTRQMRGAADKALAIDPDLVFARAISLMGNSDGNSVVGVIEAYSRAARERPSEPAILRNLTWYLMITGYLDEALRAARRRVEIDPLSSIAHNRYAAVLNSLGRVNEAVAAMEAGDALTPIRMDWFIGELYLAENRDEAAIERMQTYVREIDNSDPAWVDELVTLARDRVSGQAYLDEQIPAIARTFDPDGANFYQDSLNRWYLIFGYLDRYFEVILDELNNDENREGVEMHVFYGVGYRRLGFTAHPKFLEVAEIMGYIDVWEQRGPPDFCAKIEGQWVCE